MITSWPTIKLVNLSTPKRMGVSVWYAYYCSVHYLDSKTKAGVISLYLAIFCGTELYLTIRTFQAQ